MRTRRVPSPVGELRLSADGGALVGLHFTDDRAGSDDRARTDGPPADGSPRTGAASHGLAGDDTVSADERVLDAAEQQLAEYFAGTRETFDLPLAPRGSDFQRRVWAALREIPYGTTTTYGEIARRLGLPTGASRAVGLANGQNPIAVVVPCHRVIGADGGLTGFGGGIPRKETLLTLEGTSLF
jgi:methylated-DNA-[protein]-cysteine S-methyltransferase